ncbi:secretion/conjugation apparatus DotM-related subunit [Variovorax sp. JS1663]|uniref:secretion/conjugation apparatus DotM-related subunit n=1 Tax=Variovorax sp. JS1663 TaxID=1851577 RepID=UPI000B347840|nr:hypothetical protein [Variovorax sp. JS1663]OUM00705.1 hypothetical protein A8M77_19655 [Variovorax sp. JS1663]
MAKANSATSNAASAESQGIQMVLGMGLVVLILGAAIWFTGSNRIVYYFTPFFKAVAWLYNLVPGGGVTWGRISYLHDAFRARPKDVSIFDFLRFIDMALLPLVALTATAMVGLVAWTFTRKANKLARKPTPESLTQILSRRFSGVVPVMHLGSQLILDQLPKWRRQVWPEEVLMKHKINGKPMLTDSKVNLDQIRLYFQGEPKLIKGTNRLKSHMLGIQLVSVMHDRGKKVVYPDRMSPTGKVMYALLVAHAFGGKEGKKEYERAMNELNYSCTAHPDGLPNLTVAQWIFDKYRTHEKAANLFAVHHWEYTYLYALFFMAKRQGKVTHRQWIWLKPQDRILFYVLNTVLRKVPHTESAAVWCQYDFERKAAKAGLVPVSPQGHPQIVVQPAEEAMVEAWNHYVNGTDDDEDKWWAEGQVWRRANNVKLQAPPLPPAEALEVANADTRFDDEARGEREESARRFNAKSRDGAQSLMGNGESMADFAALAAAAGRTGAAGRAGAASGGIDF